MRTKDGRYTLTQQLVTAFGGGPVVCLDHRALGRQYQLHTEYPRATCSAQEYLASVRSEVISPDGQVEEIITAEESVPCTVVEVRGPLEQRAGYHDECGGFSDGHDAVAERMCMALVEGDVVMVIDSPGGAHAGLQEAVRRVQEQKEKYGRTVVVYADEMIGSAAYWWAAAVGDYIALPEAGIVGSIGARSSHCSMAGHLAQEGVAVTYFAWPGEGKVAFAPEQPLSELGKERGERDVNIAGVAFAKAVAAARGLDVEYIADLDADALTGQAAVDAGLADAVASLEDVLQLAVESSRSAGANQSTTQQKAGSFMPKIKAAAKYERTTKEKYEDDGAQAAPDGDEDDKKDDDMDEDEKSEDMGEGEKSEEERMDSDEDKSEEERMDSDEDEEEDKMAADGDEEPPPSSKPAPAPPMKKKPGLPPANHPPPPQQRKAARMSVAKLCGLRDGASEPAIAGAVLRKNRVIDAVASLTGTRNEAEMVGHLRAIGDDLARLSSVETENDTLKKRAAYRKRMDLLRQLSAAKIPGYTRGELFVDEQKAGKLVTKPSPVYSEMNLQTLEGLVKRKLSSSPARRSTPFEPDSKGVEQASGAPRAYAEDAQRIATASTASAEQIAKTMAALAQQGAFDSNPNFSEAAAIAGVRNGVN